MTGKPYKSFSTTLYVISKIHQMVKMVPQKRSDSYAGLAYKVLKEAGKPMHYVDITKEVLKVKETKGKTPQKTLRVILIRDERFVKINRGIYGLKERSAK